MSFKLLVLLLIIIASGVFIYLKVETLGDLNSNFNQTTRFKLGESSLWRTALSLHNYGDARYWYLQPGTGPFVVEIAQSKDLNISDNAVAEFTKQVQNVTGRQVQVFNDDKFKTGTLTDSDLNDIVSSNRRHVLAGQPNLFIMYADDYARDDGEVGKTYKEFGMVLSNKRLVEVIGNSSLSFNDYVESTMLHEFGHQLGLEHNDQEGCLMNERIEKPSGFGEFFGQINQTGFCDFELKQLNAIKAAYK